MGQIPPIILARLLYLGAGPGLLALVLQVLGNCAMPLLVKQWCSELPPRSC